MSNKIERMLLTATALPKSGTASSATPTALPGYLLSVQISNFRCFSSNQKLQLCMLNNTPARWTIILGDNGVGKTTLLQTIAALRPTRGEIKDSQGSDSFYPGINYYKSIHDFYNEMFVSSRNQSGHISLDLSLSTDINEKDTSKSIAMSVAASYGLLGKTETANEKTDAHIPALIVRGDHRDLSGSVTCGYGASRRPGRTAIAGEQTNDACASLFSESAELVNAEEWLLQADYAASKGQERAKQRLEKVIEVLKGLLPDVSNVKFEPLSDQTDLPTVQAKTPYGWVPIRSLSLGYQSLITWTVDLASRLFTRYPDSPNPLAEPAVVLVDEIDLHLHPKWQRTLIQFLTDTFPKTQFIVTAHSPLVVQAAPDANIVVLRREGDHVVIDNDVKVVEGWRADQILTSDLFGLSSARPPEWDAFLDERDQILSKHTLSEQDHVRLKELENLIAELPTGESSSDLEAMDIIRRAATMLKRRGNTGK